MVRLEHSLWSTFVRFKSSKQKTPTYRPTCGPSLVSFRSTIFELFEHSSGHVWWQRLHTLISSLSVENPSEVKLNGCAQPSPLSVVFLIFDCFFVSTWILRFGIFRFRSNFVTDWIVWLMALFVFGNLEFPRVQPISWGDSFNEHN